MLVNLVPVWGVWFRQWNATGVFIVYCMESIIAGLYNALMMFLAIQSQKTNTVTSASSTDAGGKNISGYWLILFFLVHYGFFVFIQVSIFLEIAEIGDGSVGTFTFITHVLDYLSEPMQWVLLLFIASYGLYIFKDFLLSGMYKNAKPEKLLFAPYARIFIQQFCVILGGIFLHFGAGKVFILIFVLVKIFFENMLDSRKIIADSVKPEAV